MMFTFYSKALITNKNSPNVNMVTGIVSMTNTGLTIAFSRAITIARIIAVSTPSTCTPGSNQAVIRIAKTPTIKRLSSSI